jgi:hypothetical protein
MVPVVSASGQSGFASSERLKVSLSYSPHSREAIARPAFASHERQILPPGRNEAAAAAARHSPMKSNSLNYREFIFASTVARSLLI